MKIAVVTTFDADGWTKYAHAMLRSFEEYWPRTVKLFAFAEGCAHLTTGLRDLDTACPSVEVFKRDNPSPGRRGRGGAAYNYRFDAVRFCHKVFATETAMIEARASGFDALIWLDADVLTHSPIPEGFLSSLLEYDGDVAYLARSGRHSETGFIVYRTNDLGESLVRAVADRYRSGEVFALAEWHDAFVFDICRRELEASTHLNCTSLSDGYEGHGHPFVNSRLGQYMDHLKGDARKEQGRSKKRDLVNARAEAWWA